MAVGMTTALLLGGGAFSAATQIGAGNAQAKAVQKQAEYNAQVYGQQAEMIKQKKQITDYQFNRESASVRGSVMAKTAGKGFLLSGSPLAIMIDNESNMQFDKAIADYNSDIETNYALSGARYQRESGAANARLAKTSGYTNAFTTMLNTGVNYGLLNIRKP